MESRRITTRQENQCTHYIITSPWDTHETWSYHHRHRHWCHVSPIIRGREEASAINCWIVSFSTQYWIKNALHLFDLYRSSDTTYSPHSGKWISRMNPLKYLFEKPALSNRTAKWLMMLSEFEIAYVVPKAVKQTSHSWPPSRTPCWVWRRLEGRAETCLTKYMLLE